MALFRPTRTPPFQLPPLVHLSYTTFNAAV